MERYTIFNLLIISNENRNITIHETRFLRFSHEKKKQRMINTSQITEENTYTTCYSPTTKTNKTVHTWYSSSGFTHLGLQASSRYLFWSTGSSSALLPRNKEM